MYFVFTIEEICDYHYSNSKSCEKINKVWLFNIIKRLKIAVFRT